MCKVKFNKRFFGLLLVFALIFTLVPATHVVAYTTNSGWNQLDMSAAVYELGTGTYLGQVDPGEGVTVFGYVAACPYPAYYIEYNTLNGPQCGCVSISAFKYANNYPNTASGVVTTSGSTYYSPGTSLYAGYVGAGENVAVLCDNGSWAYIEYNIGDAMRKRAFIQSSKISSSSQARTSFYHQNPQMNMSIYVDSYVEVFAGPNGVSYESIGYVEPGDTIVAYLALEDKDDDTMYYIAYPTNSGTKYGYVYASDVI